MQGAEIVGCLRRRTRCKILSATSITVTSSSRWAPTAAASSPMYPAPTVNSRRPCTNSGATRSTSLRVRTTSTPSNCPPTCGELSGFGACCQSQMIIAEGLTSNCQRLGCGIHMFDCLSKTQLDVLVFVIRRGFEVEPIHRRPPAGIVLTAAGVGTGATVPIRSG